MGMLSLPPEIISDTCRYVGALFNEQNTFCGYKNQDLQSLRLTCRYLYENTTYDATIRYGIILDKLYIEPDHSGLCLLLHLTSIPDFRDRITRIMLKIPKVKQSYIGPRSEFEATIIEDMNEDANLSEIFHLLAECFHNLKRSASFLTVGTDDERLDKAMLGALSATKFPRRVWSHDMSLSVGYRPEPEPWEDEVPEQLMLEFKHYMMSMVVRAPQLKKLKNETEKMRLRKHDEESNDIGYHFKDFNGVDPGIAVFISDCNELLELEVHGCEEGLPRLRFCNGCNDLFVNTIDITHYPSLTRFHIGDMYISGGRLRRFIKEHGSTLTNVVCCNIFLTDGSWRSIAQALQKLPLLDIVKLNLMFQKQKAERNLATWVFQPLNACPSNVEGILHIPVFLQKFVNNFCTETYREWAWREKCPRYQEVVLYRFTGVNYTDNWKRAWLDILRYSEMEDKKTEMTTQ